MGFSIRLMVGASVLLASVGTSLAASNNDPDWPCVQRKVTALSIGQMWPIPLEEGKQVELSGESEKLVRILALRRVDEEEAKQYVSQFAKAHPDTTANEFGTIYSQVLARLNHDRSRLISGIGRYAHSQQARAESINKLRVEMEEAEQAEKPDFDAIDKMEEKIDWNERIYKDRETSLTYVCETPVIIEQRAFMIAKLLLPYAEKAQGGN